MVQRNSQNYIVLFVSAITIFLLFSFLRWHFLLGLTRYFDVDEYAYLHWAYQIFSGQKPYTDFFLYVPPGYQWFLAPLFWLGRGTAPLLAARVQAFLVFAGLAAAVGLLFWLVRRSWLALLAAALLPFLPLPFDKFLEIRPDTLAALLVVIGIIWQICWMRTGNRKRAWLAGMFYGLSLIVLPKSVPAVGVGLLVGLIWWLEERKNGLLAFAGGLAVPLILFGLWTLTLGNPGRVYYSLFRLPFEVNEISRIFYMGPDLFFYPNSIFYGAGGWPVQLIVNHALWVTGILIGILSLLAPYLTASKAQKTGVYEEVLIAGIFIVQIVYYVLWSPLKHAQYLIPIAVWVAFYAADGWNFFWQWARGTAGKSYLFVFVFLLLAAGLYKSNILAEKPKLSMNNQEALATISEIQAKIPSNEFLLDLDGRTIYYPGPYYVCCLPFGQYAPYLTRPLPSLSEALEKTKTRYIWQGEPDRLTTLAAGDQEYIAAHYANVKEIQGLLVRD